MLISEYGDFVARSDKSAAKAPADRSDIAIYGLVGEIGSLFSAIKKSKLAGAGPGAGGGGAAGGGARGCLCSPIKTPPRAGPGPGAGGLEAAEVAEELGDVLWYCMSLSHVENPQGIDVFAHDVAELRAEIGAGDPRAERIGTVLKDRKEAFLGRAEGFGEGGPKSLGDYQRLTFLTARTEGGELQGVCMAVLWQLGAEIARRKLPPVELELNRLLPDRPVNKVLGEIAWHIAALATLEGLSLDAVAEANRRKVDLRYLRGEPTPLHDAPFPEQERFPRRFEIAFVTVGKGRSRMYLGGRRLGDDLTDNAKDDDGYRFHDVMHLANAAVLGWSPVLRDLIRRKRKSDPAVDEVQDGARARITEELIVKFVHSEGASTTRAPEEEARAPESLFRDREHLSFKFLGALRRLCAGLEVEANRMWEWEDAILAGSELFRRLRTEGQGTVSLDLNARRLEFSPEVYVDLPGAVADIGTATLEHRADTPAALEAYAKAAILDALGLSGGSPVDAGDLRVHLADPKRPSVKSTGAVQAAMWRKRVVAFKLAWSTNGGGSTCTAFALSDSTAPPA